MDIVFTILAAVCLIVGFIGCIVPVIPGVPLAWCGILLGYFISFVKIPLWLVILCGIVAVVVSILDNFLPSIMTKKSGGSKAGTRGCMIGLIIGMFTGPWGIILGPFIGALIGELIHDSSNFKSVLKAAFGAFGGFCCGVGMKMIATAIFITIFVIFAVRH